MLLFAGSLQLWGCEQSPENADSNADEALKAQLEAAASTRVERASMSFGFIHTLDDIPKRGPVSLTLDDGTQVEVQQAYLVVSAIEAHLCEPGETPTRNGPTQRDIDAFEHEKIGPDKSNANALPDIARKLSDWLISPAFAHVPSSATRLGTPFVENLLAPGQARIIDEIAPPMASYCRLYAIVSPADDDIVNLTDLDTADIVGKTLLLRGRYRAATEAAGAGGPPEKPVWHDFESVSEARNIIEMDAFDPQTGQAPLTLDKGNKSRMLLLDKRVSPDLFDGLARDEFDTPAAANQVLERLEKRFKIYRLKRK